jgi:tetratricopeptide (TPR) repeat protein
MKQTQFDKHTIAWFKIAECVSRGEKERALGVYRLLSHSFNDNAIARQLEADIYCSFGESEQAIALYQQAMESYTKSQRFLEAAAVGEHLITMRLDHIALHRELFQLYISLGMLPKVRTHVNVLVDLFVQKQQWYEIKNIVVECARFSDGSGRVGLYGDIIVAAHKAGCPWDIVAYSIEQALDNLCLVDSEKCVQGLLSILQAHSDELYDHAVAYLAK